MLVLILTLTALAQSPTPSHPLTPTDAETRLSLDMIRRNGRVTTYTGLGTIAAAVPAGLLVSHSLTRNCRRECMGGPLIGAATGVLMLTTGSILVLAGQATSAVGRSQARQTVAMTPLSVTGTF